MAITERLSFILQADSSVVVREFEKVGRSADKDLGSAERRIDAVGAGFTKAGAAMLGIGTLAVVGLGKAAQATSSLGQAQETTGRIFGESRDIVDAFARESVEAVGLSERAYRQHTSTLGAFLQNLGFTQDEAAGTADELARMGADLSAAFDSRPEDAIAAIGSALRGERDPIEQFAISIKQADVNARVLALGLDTSTTASKKNAEAIATLDLIQTQAALSTGAFAAEADSLTGKQARATAEFENFQAALGEGVLPIMTSLLGTGTQLLGYFTELNEATNGAASTAVTWAAGLTLAGGAVSTVVGTVIKARTAIQAYSASVTAAQAASLGWVGALAALGVMILSTDLDGWRTPEQAQRDAAYSEKAQQLMQLEAQAAGRLGATLEATTGKITDNTRATLAAILADNGYADAVQAAGLSIDDLLSTVESRGRVGAYDIAAMLGLDEADLQGFSSILAGFDTALDSSRGKVELLSSTSASSSGLIALRVSADAAAEAVDKLDSELEQLFNDSFGVDRATREYTTAISGLGEGLKNAKADGDVTPAEFNSLQQGWEDTTESAAGYLQARVDAGATPAELQAAAAYIEGQMGVVGAAFAGTGLEIQKYLELVGRASSAAVGTSLSLRSSTFTNPSSSFYGRGGVTVNMPPGSDGNDVVNSINQHAAINGSIYDGIG